MHLWSKWNRAYVDMETPRLIVRYEDLLFNPEEVSHPFIAPSGRPDDSTRPIPNQVEVRIRLSADPDPIRTLLVPLSVVVKN